MTTTPEIKPNIPEIPQGQVEQGEAPKEAPAPVEQNIVATPGPFTVQPSPQQAQIQSAPSDDVNVVTITVPATPQQLEDWAKGPPDSSLTWLSFYWIRMIKKALFHGWRVMTAQPQPAVM
jgi:hypothetical protein